MASVAKTPLVFLTGITPSGLNASSEGEIRVFYDYIKTQQENLFRHNLEIVLKILMLNRYGYIDEDITFEFVDLFSMTEKEHALIRKSDADSSAVYVQMGAIDRMEVRKKIAMDPISGFNNLDVNQEPEMPAGGLLPGGGGKTHVGESNPMALSPEMAMHQGDDVGLDIATCALDMLSALEDQHRSLLDSMTAQIFHDEDPFGNLRHLTQAAASASELAQGKGTRQAHQEARYRHGQALEGYQRHLANNADLLNEDQARLVSDFLEAHAIARDIHNAHCNV
jgi:hypothetical protein